MNDDLYREQILDHNANPRNTGELPDADIDQGKVNVACGDEMRVLLKLDGDRIATMRFVGRGCAISQASASMLTELLPGKSLDAVTAMGAGDITTMLGVELSPSRLRCALLALETAQRGIAQYRGRSHD